MKVIKIEECSKTKCRVILENEETIILYKADLKRCHIKEGSNVTKEQLRAWIEEVLPHRARARCLKLLQSKDYTEYEIRKKLYGDGYPDTVISEAIQYLYGYHYLDDERYVKLYYQSRVMRKSTKQIVLELQQRGVKKEIIDRVLEEVREENPDGGDLLCIQRLLVKKKYDDNSFTYDEKEKMKASLFRKGFQINDINRCMQNFSWKNWQ